jgi:hypothetical protein
MSYPTDLQVMHLEAEFIDTINELKNVVDQYTDAYPYLNLTPENSQALKVYYQGLLSIAAGTKALADGFKAVCGCKNISLS